jgi:membrane protease YdiL (CAAX protease family)
MQKRLSRFNYLSLILPFFLCDQIYSFGVSYLLNEFDPSIIEAQSSGLTLLESFILTVCFAPIAETIIAQTLCYEILQKIISEKICFHFSALIFAIAHYQNILLVLALIPIGYLYVFFYKKIKNRYSVWLAFFSVCLVHLLSNLISLFIEHF